MDTRSHTSGYERVEEATIPLIGLIDPSHAEAMSDEPGRYPKWTPIEEVLAKAEHASPKWSQWTYELMATVLAEQQERTYISTSLLIAACPRSAVIERREDYVGTLDSLWASVRGTLIHRSLESSARPNSLAEWRFWTTIDGQKVSCSPDLVSTDPGVVWDYKVTENPPTFGYPWKSHTKQVQINRFIVNNAEGWKGPNGETAIPINPREIVFKHAALVYLGPKGPKVIEVMKAQDFTTPNGRTIRRKMPYIWTDEEVLAEVRPRLDAMTRALESYPEWPDGIEEVFGGPPGWACPGKPICNLPDCIAKRWPKGLLWKSPAE